MDEDPIYLQHNSCTDISLITEEYYNQLKNPPTIRQGSKLNLWQLMDKNTQIQGYVKLPMFSKTIVGDTIKTEVEVYVVLGMSVSVLLGEDYQLSYKLTIHQNLQDGITISFRSNSIYQVLAIKVNRNNEFQHLFSTKLY